MGKRELIALLNLSSWCLVMVELLFLAVPRGCLQFVIVVFPDHTHLLFLLTPQFLHSTNDQNYYISINSATAYFLARPLAAFVARANTFVSASSCKQGANEGISQAGHTQTKLLLLKCRVLSRVLLHSPHATPDLNLWFLFLSKHSLCPGDTAARKIMEWFIVIFSQEILPVFRYDSYLIDRPTGGCRLLVFPLLMLFDCRPNMCHTLNPLVQQHKK